MRKGDGALPQRFCDELPVVLHYQADYPELYATWLPNHMDTFDDQTFGYWDKFGKDSETYVRLSTGTTIGNKDERLFFEKVCD